MFIKWKITAEKAYQMLVSFKTSVTYYYYYFFDFTPDNRVCVKEVPSDITRSQWGFPFSIPFRFFKVYIFVQQKAWTLWLWNVIIPFKSKTTGKPHRLFALRPVCGFSVATRSFTIQWLSEWDVAPQELIRMKKNFLNLENRSFENSFSH